MSEQPCTSPCGSQCDLNLIAVSLAVSAVEGVDADIAAGNV